MSESKSAPEAAHDPAQVAADLENPKPATPDVKKGEVALLDERGHAIGVVARVERSSEAKDASDHVVGWSTLKVDGEPYTFSRARARELLARFPHFAEQVREAVGDKG